jgi:hypothetical protein
MVTRLVNSLAAIAKNALEKLSKISILPWSPTFKTASLFDH